MYGNNKEVVQISVRPYAKLNKRHNNLYFHKVREDIASGMINFVHLPGRLNPEDILSNNWSHCRTWSLLQPILFWEGDTLLLNDRDNENKA